MITLLLTISISNFISSNVQAVNLSITKAELYSKGEVVLFNYDSIGIGVEVIVYQKDGKEYPAYCINKGRPGVTEEHGYTVNINQLLTNNGIWKAIVNGYPFKTLSELGCNTMQEAYAATKMAVYDAMYHYDLTKFTIHNDSDSNRRVVAAIKKIITNARNMNDSKTTAILKVKEVTEQWKVDEFNSDYVSKTYKVEASASYQSYQIKMQGENPDNVRITNMKNEETNTFLPNESFKAIIPISELESSGEFTLSAIANLATMPILYGESPNPDWQNFAITAGTYELANTIFTDKYNENKTKIEIQKQDGDTQNHLANAVFQLLDENHKVIYTDLTTDETGSICVNYLKPGTYYLKEIQAPIGYYGYDEEIKIEVKLNEKIVISIDNYLEPKQEREEKPQDENHISAGEKKEILPRTGF